MFGTRAPRSLVVALLLGLTALAGLASPPALAANVCDPTTGTDCAKVDGTPDAMRTVDYDKRGNYAGQKRTYTASTVGAVATAAGTGPFFAICGSASNVIRVQEIQINGAVGTAATRSAVAITKTSTATSAGTATALVQVPHDTGHGLAGTSSLVNYYTVLATTGTAVGTVGSRYRTFPITATIAATDLMDPMVFDFARRVSQQEGEGVILRGTAQCLQAAFPATTTNAPTLTVSVTWTEQDNTSDL